MLLFSSLCFLVHDEYLHFLKSISEVYLAVQNVQINCFIFPVRKNSLPHLSNSVSADLGLDDAGMPYSAVEGTS